MLRHLRNIHGTNYKTSIANQPTSEPNPQSTQSPTLGNDIQLPPPPPPQLIEPYSQSAQE